MPERRQERVTRRAQPDGKPHVQHGSHRQSSGSDGRGVYPIFPTDLPDRGSGRPRFGDFTRARQHGFLGGRSAKVHQGEEERTKEDQWVQQQRVNIFFFRFFLEF